MSAFGALEDITLADWQDAWINRLEIIKKTSEKDIYKYFKAHKKYVSQQEDFAEEFEAYKHFDIYFSRHYSNTRFKMNPQQYSSKVLEFKLKFPHSFFTMKPLAILPVPKVGSQHQLVRYEPYNQNKGTRSGSSFPKGTNLSTQAGQCLICGRFGHRGSNGIYNPSANPTTKLQTTSAPYAGPKTIHFPPVNVSNFAKIVTPYNADEFDALLH